MQTYIKFFVCRLLYIITSYMLRVTY